MTRRLLFVAAFLLLGTPAFLGAQMPDPSQMNGLSMPTPDLPNGTVSVRVIRGQLTNNLQGVTVDLIGAGEPRHGQTGADGRALFSGVPAGSTVHAVAVVRDERRESQPFEVPAQGGIRTILVFSETSGASPGAAAPAAGVPPAAGATSGTAALSIGGSSRVAAEFNDDTLQVFYLLEIVNHGQTPVSPATALVFDMPTGAEGTTVLEGSTRQANAKGPRVTVTGPVSAGRHTGPDRVSPGVVRQRRGVEHDVSAADGSRGCRNPTARRDVTPLGAAHAHDRNDAERSAVHHGHRARHSGRHGAVDPALGPSGAQSDGRIRRGGSCAGDRRVRRLALDGSVGRARWRVTATRPRDTP